MWVETVLGAVTLVLLLVVWLAGWLRSKGGLASIPGPQGSFWSGNADQVQGHAPYTLFTSWAKEYGPVFKLSFYGRPVVVLNDYQSAYTAMVTRGQDFAGRPSSFRISYIKNNSAIVFADPTPKWKKLRKTCQSCFKAFGPGMSRIENLALQMTEDFLAELAKTRGEPTNPRMIIHNAVTKMMCLLVVGESYEENSDVYTQVKGMLGRTNEFLSSHPDNERLDKFPWLRYLGNRTFQRLKEAKEMQMRLFADIKQRYQATVSEHADSTCKPAVHALFELLKEDTPAKPSSGDTSGELKFQETDIQPTVFELILAGISTTSNSLFSLINILLHHPEVKLRLQKEVDEVVGARRVALADKEHMPYLCATILELFRYSSNFAIANPHKTLKDTKVVDHAVPKNTQVWINLWAIHHDETFWGDPWSFRPERFLDDEGALLPPDNEKRRHVIPFGAGSRVCLGESLARARIFIWIASMLQRFEMKPDPSVEGKLTSCDPRTYSPGLVAETQPYKVVFLSRK